MLAFDTSKELVSSEETQCTPRPLSSEAPNPTPPRSEDSEVKLEHGQSTLREGSALSLTDGGAYRNPVDLQNSEESARQSQRPAPEPAPSPSEITGPPLAETLSQGGGRRSSSPRQSEMSLVAENFQKLNGHSSSINSRMSTAKQSSENSEPGSPSRSRPREDDDLDAEELTGRLIKRARTDTGSEPQTAGPEIQDEREAREDGLHHGYDGQMDVDMPDAQHYDAAEMKASPLRGERPAAENAMTLLRQKHLINSLRNAKKNQVSMSFRRPVDPIALGLPTYFDHVKTPMDMSTIESNLAAEKYATVDEYFEDVDLMVQNTVAFNGPAHAVTLAGRKLQELLSNAREKLPAVDEQPPSAAERRQKKIAQNLAITKVEVLRRASAQPPPIASPVPSIPDSPATTPTINGIVPVRRESTLGDRPKRQIHPPAPKELTYPKSRTKKNKIEMQFCENLIREYIKPENSADFAWPFLQPVDPVALNIPEYFKIVQHPMDLGTMLQKLSAGQYDAPEDFNKDLELVVQDCFLFNQPGDPVHLCGQKLKKRFEVDWKGKAAWVKQQQMSPGARTPTSTATPADSEEESEESEEPSEDENAADNRQLELRAINAEVDAAKLRIQLAQNEISKKQDQIKMDKDKLDAMTKKLSALKKKPTKRPSTGGSKQKIKKRKTIETSSALKGSSKSNRKSGSGVTHGASSRKPAKKKGGITQIQQEWMVASFGLLSASSQEKASRMIIDNQPSVSGEQEVDLSELPPDILLKLLNLMLKELPGPKSWHNDDAGVRKGTASKGQHTSKSKKHKPMTASAAAARQEMLAGKMSEFTSSGRVDSPEAIPSIENDLPESSGDEDAAEGSESEEE